MYEDAYFQSQLRKFINRKSNHWAPRIQKVFDLVSRLDLPGKKVLDLGTSVGTYAYEFASRGFEVTGIDLSEKALSMAKQISQEDGKNIRYIVGDTSERDHFEEGGFDLIYAGDIIEHLDSNILQKTLINCYYWVKTEGFFVFHTVPTKYDVIFHKTFLWIFLIPFFFVPENIFNKITRLLYEIFDVTLKVTTGKSWQERERNTVHCNLQTKESLLDVLKKAHFKVVSIQLTITEERFLKKFKTFLFGNKEYFQKDIFGLGCKESIT